MMNIFDTHAHYDDSRFDEDRDLLLSSFSDKGVKYIINCGTDIKTSNFTVDLTKKYDYIYGAVGIHPEEADKAELSDLSIIEELADNNINAELTESSIDFSNAKLALEAAQLAAGKISQQILRIPHYMYLKTL